MFGTPNKGVGIPYQGGKQKTSKSILDIIEKENPAIMEDGLIDAFGGGGSISCECLMRKIPCQYNELNKEVFDLFQYVMTNRIDLSKMIISRKEFYGLRGKESKTPVDNLLLTINSFGTNRSTYIYGENISDMKWNIAKKILDENPYGFIGYRSNPIYLECIESHGYDKENAPMNRIQQLSRLNQFRRLNLVRQLGEVEMTNLSYEDLDYTDKVVFLDPPYINRSGYGVEFDTIKFYKFVKEEIAPVAKSVYLTEYTKPSEDWKLIKEFKTSRGTLAPVRNRLDTPCDKLFRYVG